jgi:tetratricopeptide (TPR) repeat protein
MDCVKIMIVTTGTTGSIGLTGKVSQCYKPVPSGPPAHSSQPLRENPVKISRLVRRCAAPWLPRQVRLRTIAFLLAALAAAIPAGAQVDPFEQRLAARVAASPGDASSWRLLGRYQLEHGRSEEALEALQRSVDLDPLSAAAQFDLGRALLALEQNDEAAGHLDRVLSLAPDSEYAQQARDLIETHGLAGVQQAGYEIHRFDDTDKIQNRLPLTETLERRFFNDYELGFDFGTQFNSNVALTPLSRYLSAQSSDSFQLLFSPTAQLNVYDSGTWRTGTTYAGDYTLNEGNFSHFNLQSYRPGLFFEQDVATEDGLFVPRLDYEFGLDEFNWSTFATRHQVTASSAALWSQDEATIVYWSIDYTDFRNDGAIPWITSRDGWTNTLGASHEVALRQRWVRLVRGGLQFQRSDADGSDFRYNGVEFSGDVVVPLWWKCEAELRAGWGYRDYPDFVSGPARNENIITAGAELRRGITENLTAAAVFAYDRFISDNVRFDAERVLGGVMLMYQR